MKTKIIFFVVMLFAVMFSQHLFALTVTIYGSGGVQITIINGQTTIKICPEAGNQAYATLTIEGGEIKEIKALDKENENVIQAINSLLKTHEMKIIYPFSMVDNNRIEGKNLTIIAIPKDGENEYQLIKELIKTELMKTNKYKIQFEKNSLNDEKVEGEDIIIYLEDE